MADVVLFSDVRGAGGTSDTGYIPLSLLTIASFMETERVTARVIDAQFEPDWRQLLASELGDAVYLGISALTGPSLATALEAVAFARSAFPAVPVVWGGYHATQSHAELLREGLADMVVVGPGEHAALALAKALKAERRPGEWPRRIPNVASLVDGQVSLVRTTTIVDPKDLPRVNYSFVDVEKYIAARNGELSYISSYGCPHACSFCAEPAQTLRKWKGRTPRQVADDLRALHDRYKPRQINICDPNFSSSIRRVMDIVGILNSEGLTFDKLCDMRATDVLRLSDVLDLGDLRKAGFRTVYLGAESGSDGILSALAKGVSTSQILEACRQLDAADISTIVSFMHDLPQETDEDSVRTLDFARELATLPLNLQRHHFYTPFPATEMFKLPAVQGALAGRRVQQSDWARSSTYAPGLWSGRREFRERCLTMLSSIRSGLADPLRVTLPSLT